MSLDVYRRFLSDQSAQSTSLAPDVSLNYIPTTTKVEGIDAVRSHLAKQERLVKTKAQKILDVVEGASSLCVDVETTLEFDHGGGAYLPSLDENFLTGRVASFPTVPPLCRVYTEYKGIADKMLNRYTLCDSTPTCRSRMFASIGTRGRC